MSVGTGFTSRDVDVTIGTVTIAGTTSKGLTVNNEPLDTSDDFSAGNKEYLAEPGVKTVEFTFSGKVKNLSLLQSILASGSQIYAITIDYPDGTTTNSTITGDAFLGSYSETGEHEGLYTFDASLMFSGAVIFTAGT